jgi:UDP-glucose 4-epimerase
MSTNVSGTAEARLSSYYHGRRVMVTGGLGFIGSNLARRLLEFQADVLVVDPLLPTFGGNRANLADCSDRLRIFVQDISDSAAITELLQGIDVVFNLAGHVSHLDSMRDPVTDLNANVRAQIILLEACRKEAPGARVVFASTRQIYGRPSRLPVDETHPLQPVDVNGVNKMAAEAYHKLYHQVYDLDTVSLRLTNTYGPRMRVKDARQTFLGIWLRRVVESGVIEVWGGEQKRDLTYVDDVVDAFLLAGASREMSGNVYNLGGSETVTLARLAEMLISVAGTGTANIVDFPAERRRIDIGDYFADDRRFRAATGWEPKVTLSSGLARSVDYYRMHLGEYV